MNTPPQITSSEISEWENKFKQEVNPSVQFAVGNNAGKSMMFYNGETGTDAQWSGTITLQNDSWIKWNFKLKNEPFLEAKVEFTEECSTILTNLYTFYLSWKDEWGKKLTVPDENREDVEGNTDGAPTNVPPTPPSGNQAGASMGAAPQPGGQPQMPVNENLRNKKSIISSNRERMMRLAKLWK